MKSDNPQVEDGYTKIVNSIVEALCQTDLSGTEMRMVLFLLRKTYGWNKKIDAISQSQFAEGVNINRRNVNREIKRLINRNIQ